MLAGCGTATNADALAQELSASPSASATYSPAPSPTPASAVASASPSPSNEPSAGSEVDASPDAASHSASSGTAAHAALALTVKGKSASTGYERDEYGSGWVDVDRNGCDTRNDMLNVRLVNLDMSGTCKVLAGDLADPYTGTWIHFERGGASEVDIDHMVALGDAWIKGASSWEFAKRVAFANDPLNLEPVDASANRQKGASDASAWLPSYKAFRCEYVARQVAVKTKYGLWVTQPELDAIVRVLDSCPDEPLPAAGDQPVIADNIGTAPAATKTATATKSTESTPKKTSTPKATTAAPKTEPAVDERFEYCNRLPAGYGPYYEGVDPEYDWYTDRDHDGVVCE